MNAENKEQGKVDKTGAVMSALEARLMQEVEKGGAQKAADLLAPYVVQAKSYSMVKSRHEELMDIPNVAPDMLRDEFLMKLADRTIDQTTWEMLKQRIGVFMPGGIVKVPWTAIQDGSLAGLLMVGAIGDRPAQEIFAERAKPGMAEQLLQKAMPLLINLAPEPDSKAFLIALSKAMKVKNFALEALTLTREKVYEMEVSGESMDLMAHTLDKFEGASMASLLPVDDAENHMTTEEMHLADAMGPETKRDLELGNALLGHKETPEA